MAGGVGSRFWPVSRAARPKQLLELFGPRCLLRRTVDRLLPLVPAERQLVVTGTLIDADVRAALPDLPADNVLAEPIGRNTTAAIGWAALEARRRDPEAVLAILPADHHIADEDEYRRVVGVALDAARRGRVVTIGIRPTRPETGYGYIRRGHPLGSEAFHVRSFEEKPDAGTAARYLAGGEHLWNAGMFFAPAALVLEEIATFEPELSRILHGLDTPNPSAAVMERSERTAVVPGSFGWSDVGSWETLFGFRADGAGSAHHGSVLEIDGSGNVLFADGGTVAVVGVRDLVVVHTPDATLVCPRTESQRVRALVDRLADRDDTRGLK